MKETWARGVGRRAPLRVEGSLGPGLGQGSFSPGSKKRAAAQEETDCPFTEPAPSGGP